MVVVGLTGGIGAGKSTLSALLRDRGAIVVDVDQIGRDVIAPDGPGAPGVIARFGTLERSELSRTVFADEQARRDLESISWPLIEDELRRLVASADAELVVLDMAVLPQGLGKGIYGPVVTVEAPEQLRIERLIERGMTEDDARARMRSQVSEQVRRDLADVVIDNDDGIDELTLQADQLLAQLLAEPPRT